MAACSPSPQIEMAVQKDKTAALANNLCIADEGLDYRNARLGIISILNTIMCDARRNDEGLSKVHVEGRKAVVGAYNADMAPLHKIEHIYASMTVKLDAIGKPMTARFDKFELMQPRMLCRYVFLLGKIGVRYVCTIEKMHLAVSCVALKAYICNPMVNVGGARNAIEAHATPIP